MLFCSNYFDNPILNYFSTPCARFCIHSLQEPGYNLGNEKLAEPTRQAIIGSLNRSARIRRPRHNEINWHMTILKNLKHYQPDYKTIVPEVRIGYGRKRTALKEVVLCLDQSGSMGTSVIYSGIFGSVMASMPSLKTRMVVFDLSLIHISEPTRPY